MIAPRTGIVLLSRRVLLAVPLALLRRGAGRAADADARDEITAVPLRDGLTPPLTLGIARVALQPGAATWAATTGGARMLLVESGVLAIATAASVEPPLSAGELVLVAPPANPINEILAPAGSTMRFTGLGVSSVRNPGSRPVVWLDVAVFRDAPRPMRRAFTTDDGVSFQLLAGAEAEAAPTGPIAVELDRWRIPARSEAPDEAGRGLSLLYLEAGSLTIRPRSGDVQTAHAAAPAPYSQPGALHPVPPDTNQSVTAGAVIFLPTGSRAEIVNALGRPARLLGLGLREIA
jgi:hypothetical protein